MSNVKPLAYNPSDPWAVLICDKLGRVDGELCRVNGADSAAQDQAYARLFAASPELLEAARMSLRLVAGLQDACRQTGKRESVKAFQETRMLLEAVIAKAAGTTA